jgi:4-carboxymuconolactone decarboxylase
MASEKFELGNKIRREVVGKKRVENAWNKPDDFDRPFQEWVTESAWGASWGRGILPRKTRSLLNLAMLSALNREHEFVAHFRGAIRNGCTRDEIRETLLQVACYCGAPAGVQAFAIANRILDEYRAKGIDPFKDGLGDE